MGSPFDREAQGAKDGFNPFRDKPPMNSPASTASSGKAPQKTTTFNPTAALWEALANHRTPEETELRTMLARLGRPNAIIIGQLVKEAAETGAYRDITSWLIDRKNRRDIPHRFAPVGYVPIHNPARNTGLWLIGGVRQMAYGRADLSPEARIEAVRALQARFRLRSATALALPPAPVDSSLASGQ